MRDIPTTLASADPALYEAIQQEQARQEAHIELIASENYTSEHVLEIQGSVLTNKYAEGYPGKRYYGGCEHVDVAENLAIERLKSLYGAAYANVQPHSGSQANSAVMQALLNPGDTFLGMSLDAGGHLTHGSPVNFSGKIYNAVHYGVDVDTGLVNYDEIREQALTHKPKLIIAGFSAYSRVLDWQKIREIADEVNAYFMVDMAHISGLVAAGCYPNPVPFADVVTSTTHKTLAGPRGGIILSRDENLGKKFNSAVFPGGQGGPLMHVIAAKACAFREAASDEFKAYIEDVIENAKVMAATLVERGIDIVSGGTDNHLILLDLRSKKLTGKAVDAALSAVNITVNKNTVPGDPESPFVTSGIRIGTPAITRRGMKAKESAAIANAIADIIDHIECSETASNVKSRMKELCDAFPVYQK